MDDKLLDVSEKVAIAGANKVIQFFDSKTVDIEEARVGVNALRGGASVRRTRAIEAHTALQIAKYADIDGKELRPIFNALTRTT